MIDQRHPLAVRASRMPSQAIDARWGRVLSRKGRADVALPDRVFFDAQVQCLAGASNAGRLCVPLRIVIALLYAKQLFNQSDEGVVERCAGTPRWQLFSGGADDEHLSACEARTFGQVPPIAVRRRSGRAADADHQGRCRSQADQTAGVRLRIRAPDTRGAGLSGRGGGQAPCAYRAGDRTHLAGWRATTPQTSC